MTSQRLDEALVARGLCASRAKARDAVNRGIVRVDGAPARKTSQPVTPATELALADDSNRYVSRAALKLVHGLDYFAISPEGRHCLDLGCSTGGFTQVLLERGAAHVTGIDVGHGQLAQLLAQDPRVKLFEGVNARSLTSVHVPDDVSLIVCDVSFISLKLALPATLQLAKNGALLLALVKPQFEVGRENVGKGGIVADPAARSRVCNEIVAFLEEAGWTAQGFEESPVAGGDGNREYLVAARKR